MYWYGLLQLFTFLEWKKKQTKNEWEKAAGWRFCSCRSLDTAYRSYDGECERWWWWWRQQQQDEKLFKMFTAFSELVSCSTWELDLSDKVAQQHQQQQLNIVEAHIHTLHHLNNANTTSHTKKKPARVKKETKYFRYCKKKLPGKILDLSMLVSFFFCSCSGSPLRIFHADKIEKTFVQRTHKKHQ